MKTSINQGIILRECITINDAFKFIDEWLLACLVRNLPSDDAFYIVDRWMDSDGPVPLTTMQPSESSPTVH